MIKTSDAMLKALRGSNPTYRGVILYQGRSVLDGKPIVAIANRIETASGNVKTGAMVQTFIIRADLSPLDAIDSGADKSICGACIHRGDKAKGKPRTCYVNVGRSVESVFGAFSRGRYARPGIDFDPAILSDLFAGSAFRMGTYGDPAAVPFGVWESATAKVAALTGYTHQWKRKAFQAFKTLCMASADSERDHALAKAMGWRTFRVRPAGAPILPREVTCPASKEAGAKTICADCRACGGLSSKAKADIVIMAHGPTGGHFQ